MRISDWSSDVCSSDLRLVERYQPRLAVIACNTASTIALGHVRAALDLPIVGTVPAITPAAEMTKTGVIGVLGTDATVRQPNVDDQLEKFHGEKMLPGAEERGGGNAGCGSCRCGWAPYK